jgi:hypothetical protein
MDINKFKTDKKKEEEGVWIEIGEEARIRVARLNNEKYKNHFRRTTKPYRRQIRNGNLSEDVAERLLIDAMANTILLGWENLTEDGKAIKYSIDNAKRILSESSDFRDLVADAAGEIEAYRIESLEESKGN